MPGIGRFCRAGHQLLADNPPERFADHHPDLFALICREHIEHAIQTASRIAGMKSAQHKMTRLGGRDRERDCLQIAHFANHDHVGFAQRGAKRGSEREGVRVHLALSDMAIFRRNDVFNGILEGDTVVAPRN